MKSRLTFVIATKLRDMLSKPLFALLICFCPALESAVPAGCVAGIPLGVLKLDVQSRPGLPPLPLRSINRLGEGDRILYSPVKLRRKGGKVALVIAPAPAKEGAPLSKDVPKVEVLEPKPADSPQQWDVPFRVGVVALVYGPNGISAKRVKRFLTQDDNLMAQLADYAEKTAQTEALLAALANWNTPGPNETVDAALHGFASQYGISGAIDRNLPRDQVMLQVMQTVNPALSSVDPLAPDSALRLQQSAVLATSVAGMFLGSTVGLAATGAALFMNLRSMMFPGTEFRSSFAQVSTPSAADLDLCGKREPPRPRTRLAYLWAVRIPNAAPPALKIGREERLPERQKAPLGVSMDDPVWKIVDRAHDWRLRENAAGKEYPVKVRSLPGQKSLEIDLAASQAPPGRYRLLAAWDWDTLAAGGDVYVSPLSDFRSARLTPESQDRLRERTGKIVAQAEGADFEFVEKVMMAAAGDNYTPPATVAFSLPRGRQQGPLDRLEFEIDTRPLAAGEYSLLLVQAGGQSHSVPFKVLPPGPRIENLPLALNAGESEQEIVLKGKNLDRLAKLEADGATLELAPAEGNRLKAGERLLKARLGTGAAPGAAMALRIYAQDTSQPEVVPSGVKVLAPRPEILRSQLSLPPNTDIRLKKGELPAGAFVSASLRVRRARPETKVRLRCGSESDEAVIRVGEQTAGGSVQSISPDALFVSFDPGKWQTGCLMSVALDNGVEGVSKPYELGRVVRLPHVESFQLTEEKTGDNYYVGKLIGTGLEAIAKVGWTAEQGTAVESLPAPIEGAERKQSLEIALPWPPPSPHAPLHIWFRGETEGRLTTIRY